MTYKFTFINVYILFSLLIFCWPEKVVGQNTVTIHGIKDQTESISAKDSIELTQKVNQKVSRLRKEGYILAGIDSIRNTSNGTHIYLYKGSRYRWVDLQPGGIPVEFFKTKYQKKFNQGETVNPEELNHLTELVLQHSENNGYPFASIKLDSISINSEQGITGAFNYTSGPLISFDSILIIPESKFVKQSFLQDWLQIKEGDKFAQKLFEEVPDRISQLSFLDLKSNPEIYFYRDKAQLGLNVQKRKVNSLDLLIGFMPNATVDNNLLITGLVDLSLDNLFRSGKKLTLHWERLQVATQLLDIYYKHPFLFRSPLTIETGFNLLKQDSTFLNRSFELGAGYALNNSVTVRLDGSFESSSVTRDSSQSDAFPESVFYSDLNVSYGGISFLVNKVSKKGRHSYKGWGAGLTFLAGNKKVELEDGDLSNSLQIRADINFKGFLPVSEKSVLYLGMFGGLLDNSNLFVNDLFRLGGIHTIRGFNENQFYASQYFRYSFEYRFLANDDSYFYGFFDQAFMNNQIDQVFDSNEQPLGFGIGGNLQTGGGQLNLAFAVGAIDGAGPDFSQSKVHFGYKAIF